MPVSKDVEKIQELEERINDIIDEIENASGVGTYLDLLKDKLKELKEERKEFGRICTECSSDGLVPDNSKVNCRTEVQPFKPCPTCGGTKIVN